MRDDINDVASSGAMPDDLLAALESNPNFMLALLTPPVSYNPIFVDITGSVTAALFLSLCLQMIDEGHAAESWNRLDFERIHKQTRMSRSELATARQRLKSLDLLEERKTGFPALTEYRVNYGRVKQHLMALAMRASADQASTPCFPAATAQSALMH